MSLPRTLGALSKPLVIDRMLPPRAGAAVMSIERLNLGALAAVVALHAAAGSRLPPSASRDAWLLVLLITTIVVARIAWRTRAEAWTHLITATAVLVSVYESLGPIIAAIGPAPRDRWIVAVEATLTRGRWPPLLPAPLPSWIIDAFSVAYIVYFALPVVVLATLVRRGWILDARIVMRTLLIAYYMHYALYVAMPVVGPIRAAEVPATVRSQLSAQGGRLSQHLRRGIGALERTPQDAFPSAHTSIAVLVALFARRLRMRGHVLFSIAAAAIVCSTVVLGYHYVVDVVAAFPIAWLAWRVTHSSGGMARRAALDRGFAPI
jgi:membrane-associated phospholipid phosphatase